MSRHGRFHHENRSLLGMKAVNFGAFLIVVLAAMAFPVYWKLADAWHAEQELRQMAQGNAEADLAAALDRGDHRLIALQRGEQVLVPGVAAVQQFEKALGRPLKLRIVAVDESFEELSDDQRMERMRVQRYAVDYNLRLIDHMQASKPRGKEPL
jgi:hypothetical protein